MTDAPRLVTFTFSVAAPGRITLTVSAGGEERHKVTRDVTGQAPKDLAGLFKADVLAWTYHKPWSVRTEWWPHDYLGETIWVAFRRAINAAPREQLRPPAPRAPEPPPEQPGAA